MATTRLQLNGAPGKPYGAGDNVFQPKTESDGSEDPPPQEGGRQGPRKKSGIGPR